jgi:serine/threonine-protein kinase RsbW
VAAIPNVRLSLPSRPENVLLVRQALRGLADALELDAVELNDISTALSEACNNVVAHAYPDGQGPMEVELRASPGALEVLVRDHGCGLKPHASEPSEIGGIGIPVMLALADSVEFAGSDGEGTDVRMRFETSKAAILDTPPGWHDGERELPGTGWLPGEDEIAGESVYLAVGPPRLARAVVSRVLAAVAARARLSTERIAATRPLAEQLVDHLGGTEDSGRLAVAATPTSRGLDLLVGPLQAGSSLDGLAPALDQLTEDHQVLRRGSTEVLALRLSEAPEARTRSSDGETAGGR